VTHVVVEWVDKDRKPSPGDVVRQLIEGEPPIAVSGGDGSLTISVWMMREDQHRIVARRLKEILAKA
jgi:hypothetical protein